ncbi:MAG TPA: hypothetical protein VFQ61_14010, partial [Polyangiaceae bacterium]|nr:hypothetical protein [Polyangiaceae bacterium]
EYAALGGIVAGPEALRRFAGAATRNTDDHPVVAYSAPRITYAPVSSPRERLMTLLQALEAHPDELLMAAPERDADRLIAYWNARNRFIELGRNVRPAPDVESMLRRVRDPLLSVLRISRDFRPAYDPLLSMAVALSRSDAESASWLLAELQTIQPARREASRALAELAARPRRLDVYEH